MKFQFQDEVLVVPGSVLSASGAGAEELRVLLWLASDLSLGEKPRQLAKLAECDVKRVQAALRFWREQGVLTVGDESVPVMATQKAAPEKTSETPSRVLLHRANELPTYSSGELADLLEKRASVRALIDEAQRILGKIFNLSEVNILVCMLDYLGMSEECVLLLLAHCKKIGKSNLRAIEKYAYTLVERNIVDPESLEEEIRTVEAMHSFEGEIRTMFGMKSRALTSRESKMLRAWVSFGYDAEIVRRAYELTVQATGDASLPYANSILERWNSEGLKTPDAIDTAIREQSEKRSLQLQKGKKSGGRSEIGFGNSFDTDDMLEAALQRSFRESGLNKTDGKP